MASKVRKINRTSAPSDDRRTIAATKVWKVKSTVVASGDSEEQNDDEEKQTGIDLSISSDHINLSSKKKKKLLVIPLRGIIVHRAHRSRPETIPRKRRPDFSYGYFHVYKRPFCVDFLKFCFERFNVGLWSSAREQNLQRILTEVMGDLKNKLLFTWDQKHCTKSGFMCLENKDKPLFLKELDILWEKKYPNLPWCDGEYSANNTLLITYPEKVLLNPPNTSISPLNYDPENKKDDFLGPKGEFRVFLDGLAEAEDVQTYVQDHPIGDPEIVPSHPHWDYYCKIICSLNKKKADKKKAEQLKHQLKKKSRAQLHRHGSTVWCYLRVAVKTHEIFDELAIVINRPYDLWEAVVDVICIYIVDLICIYTVAEACLARGYKKKVICSSMPLRALYIIDSSENFSSGLGIIVAWMCPCSFIVSVHEIPVSIFTG
ncbi:hypothetical protein SSX86_032726 [Deinandra increscens subsp. villosa]|uniref:Mitochondrial import inner membrane translocase subunit TIM50 n=1 Tax=Deinandra increscens subsp. villosa TaxID=3103831 RepID=A0AAP0C2X9_9ASTR